MQKDHISVKIESKQTELQNDNSKKTVLHDKKFYDFDVILKDIGSLEKYQLILFFIVFWISIPSGFTSVSPVFLQATPSFRCDLSPLDNQEVYNLTEDKLKELLLPLNSLTNDYEKCSRYDYNLSSCNTTLSCIQPANISSTIPCDQGILFDKSIHQSTVITDFELVCDQTTLASLLTSLFFVGKLAGSLFGGNIIDRVGRSPVMLATQIGLVGICIATSYSPNVGVYAALRLVTAIFQTTGYIAAFVYVMEITGEKWRSIMGITFNMGFAIGYSCLSGFAYKWRNWRDLQFAISFVPVPFILLWVFVPESPRWLFSKSSNNKAIKISENMALKNGKELSKSVFERAAESGEILKKNSSKVFKSYSQYELFKRPKMRIITINLMFNWFVVTLVYYGLSLNSGALAGSTYLNNTLGGVVELICYIILIFTIDKISRKKYLGYSLVVGGIACLISTIFTQFSESHKSFTTIATVFALCGKFAISGSFAIVYNYSAEVYPTCVRSTGMGVVSMASRIGGVVTPFTLQLQYSIPWLTSVIFGIFALAAGFFAFFLPETKDKKLPTTLDEAESFYRGEK